MSDFCDNSYMGKLIPKIMVPASESGRRMLGYVSSDFYEKSYVGKWLFQVMGMEWDDARKIFEELPLQMFPETATWGLMYHERKWGLHVRENLSYEERRKLIYLKRDYHSPMTPYCMEKYLRDATGFEVYIADIHDAGPYDFHPEHPNIFKVYFIGNDTLDTKSAMQIIKNLKQSHTTYTMLQKINETIDSSMMESVAINKVNLRSYIAEREGIDRFKLKLSLRADSCVEKLGDSKVIISRNHWKLDGSVKLDGSRKLNSMYKEEKL